MPDHTYNNFAELAFKLAELAELDAEMPDHFEPADTLHIVELDTTFVIINASEFQLILLDPDTDRPDRNPHLDSLYIVSSTDIDATGHYFEPDSYFVDTDLLKLVL